MITLEQVLLLEQKVESAVQKITQLQQENDALRTKCSELTNSLSSKTELLSSFEQDQDKIESGILKALDRLNAIENSVLKVASSAKALESKQTEKTSSSNSKQAEAKQMEKSPASKESLLGESQLSASISSSASSKEQKGQGASTKDQDELISVPEQFDIF